MHFQRSIQLFTLSITCIIISLAVVKPWCVNGFIFIRHNLNPRQSGRSSILVSSARTCRRGKLCEKLHNIYTEQTFHAMSMTTSQNEIRSSIGDGVDADIQGKDDSSSSSSPPSLQTPSPSPSQSTIPKLHSMTVCMVPPPRYEKVWEEVTKARTELKDPGLYRWPPHANLLYPFLNLAYKHTPPPPNNNDQEKREDMSLSKDNESVANAGNESESDSVKNTNTIQDDVFEKLGKAVQKCEPFRVVLDSFGTFGGAKRGVLYLYPRSTKIEITGAGGNGNGAHDNNNDVDKDNTKAEEDDINTTIRSTNRGSSTSIVSKEPLIDLQSTLFEHFPECPDQHKHGQFTPHVTLSHFASLQDALEGQEKLETWWGKDGSNIEFDVTEIYVLKRNGDGGQFKIVATATLGSQQGQNGNIEVHDPPLAFPGMPLEEEDWVREERMKLKARRNGNGRRGNRRRRSTMRKKKGNNGDRGPSRSRDSPEVIAQKRAERAAKRERLAREAATAAITAALDGGSDIEL